MVQISTKMIQISTNVCDGPRISCNVPPDELHEVVNSIAIRSEKFLACMVIHSLGSLIHALKKFKEMDIPTLESLVSSLSKDIQRVRCDLDGSDHWQVIGNEDYFLDTHDDDIIRTILREFTDCMGDDALHGTLYIDVEGCNLWWP